MFAPVPFNVTDPPEQMVVTEAFEPTMGLGFTVIVCVDVFVQPFKSVPVTVKVEVVVGINATPLLTPLLHVYD